MVTETKFDDSFPVSQFNVENKNVGGIILYIRSYIIAYKLTIFTFSDDIEAFLLKYLIKGNKWLICCSYNHLDHIAKGINENKGKILVMGDVNVAFTEANMAAFCSEYKLKSLN